MKNRQLVWWMRLANKLEQVLCLTISWSGLIKTFTWSLLQDTHYSTAYNSLGILPPPPFFYFKAILEVTLNYLWFGRSCNAKPTNVNEGNTACTTIICCYVHWNQSEQVNLSLKNCFNSKFENRIWWCMIKPQILQSGRHYWTKSELTL